MATSITTAQQKAVSELYVAFFNRAADSEGLGFWASGLSSGQSIETIAQNMYLTAPARAYYSTALTNEQFIKAFYATVLNRATPDAEGVAFWTAALNQPSATQGSVAVQIMKAVRDYVDTPSSPTNAAALTAKTLFAAKVDVSTAYALQGGTAAGASSVLSDVVDAATAAAAIAKLGSGTIGSTFTLTTGVDTFAGTAGNDTFNATNPAAPNSVLGGLDSVDGGAGNDTLNIADTATVAAADFALPAGFTVKNVEVLNVTTNGSIGKGGTTDFDVSGFAGLTTFKGVAAGTGTGTGSQVKAAATTDVSLTVAGTDTSTVNGGKTVAITGGGVATVTDAAGATGTTLTSVSLTNVGSAGGVTSVLTGKGIATVTLAGAQVAGGAANIVTVTNATVGHALTINAAGTGYDATAVTALKAATVVTDAAATALTVNTTVKSAVDASGSTLVKAVTLTGAGALDFAPMGAATLSIDGSTATGALTLGTLDAAAVTVKTGSGNDSFALQAIAKVTVDAGAGNDTVTLASVLAAGSTVTLGTGDDKLLGTAVVAASTATAVTVIDAGDGIDTVSAQLINAGNAAQFKNFEILSLNSTTGLDLALMTGSTITGLSMDTAGSNATYQNVKASQGFTDTFVGDNSAVVNTLSLTGVTGTADSYAITFNAAAATTAAIAADVKAGTLVTAGIENFTIVSGGVNHWNAITLGADASANTVTISGASNLNLAFAASFGSLTAPSTGVTSIDGSAATGKLVIDITNVVAATAGLTVKGGSAADTLTTSTFKSTLTGGAGADTFVVGATIAGAAAAAPVITTITDFGSGDIIKFANQGTEAWVSTKVNVATATALAGGTINALDLASTLDGSANGQISWFQYGTDTYIVEHNAATNFTAAGTNDVVIKLTGLIDLSTATFATGVAAAIATLTLA